MMKRIWLILISVICINHAAFSQEIMLLDLKQCVTLALERNPELQIAKKEVAKAQTEIWEAYSTILPSLNGSSNFQHSWEIQTSVIPNFLKPMLEPLTPYVPDLGVMPDYVELSFGLENTWTYGVQLTQPLFLGGAGIAGIKMSHAAKRATEHRLSSVEQNLIYNSADAFYGCLLTKEVILVQEEAFKQAQANLDIVKKKYDVGSASGFDKMRAEVEVANLKPEVIAARNQYIAALTGLRMVLGLPKDVRIEIDGSLQYFSDTFGDQSLTALQNLSLKNRPEISGLESQKAIAKKGITIARSQFLPKLFFQTDYSFLAMRNDYQFIQDDFSKGFTSALSLQIPIFQGFRNCKQVQKAKLDYKIVLDTEKQITDGIAAEVEIGYNKFHEAREKYQSANESIALAQEALRLANLMYEEGASTQLDILNSQLALTRARLNHAMALYEYQMARYKLRRVAGILKDIL